MDRKLSPQEYGQSDASMPAFLQHFQQQQLSQSAATGASGGGGGSQKPEWKRYKQYTRADILSAIECVRNGMSALQASRKFGVPSRTLYDKVKKLGITTGTPRNRTIKRESSGSAVSGSGSNAPFPYGLSGANFGLYNQDAHLSHSADERPELENQPPPSLAHHPMFDTAFIQQALAAAVNGINSNQHRPLDASVVRSSSPNVLIRYIHNSRNQNGEETATPIKREPRDENSDDDEEPAEDLSMTKRSGSRTPSPAPPPQPAQVSVPVITEVPASPKQQGVIVVPPIKFTSPRPVEPPAAISPAHSDKDDFKMDVAPMMPSTATAGGHDDA